MTHDALILAGVALSVLPRRQRGHALGETRHHLRRENSPIAAVDHKRQPAGAPDGLVIVKQAVFGSVGVVGRQDQQATGAGFLHAAGDFSAQSRVEAYAGDHRHAPGGGLDRNAHNVGNFRDRERVQLPGPARGNQSAERVAGHLVYIARQRVQVERKILAEGRDGESEDAAETGAQLG